MHTFIHPNGAEAGKTLTVGELIGVLVQYPKELPILAQWEGINAFITPENFDIEEVSKRNVSTMCLVIDVNDY